MIADPPIGTGQPVYRELFQTAVGLAGAAQNFDGNGRYVRANAGGGDNRVRPRRYRAAAPHTATRCCRCSGPGPRSPAPRHRFGATWPATRMPARTSTG